jgi:uncharacterized protein involved in cysteine biosynthesis
MISINMLGHGMDLSGSLQEPVAGDVNTIKVYINSVYISCGQFLDYIKKNHQRDRNSFYEFRLFRSASNILN